MPIYMDYHHFPGVTVEDVKKAHMADKQMQDKYGVKYHQFWVNQEAGTIFCLIEGPNPEACENVHKEAHGDVACNIVEVEAGLVDAFMGKGHKVDHGIVYYKDGKIDTGFRFILIVDILAKTDQANVSDMRRFKTPRLARNAVFEIVDKNKGTEVKNISDDSIIVVFNEAAVAYQCARGIQKLLSENRDIEFRIGLTEGQPVTHSDGFFEDAIDYTKQLALLANNGEIVLSKDFSKLLIYKREKSIANIKIVSETQQKFIERFFEYTEKNLSNENFSIGNISQDMGISRPQVYRKIIALTGRSPLHFVRDIKMKIAMNLIKENKLSISEIAYELGYSNPSYFSKNFKSKFGVSPSQIMLAS
ncbi:nickel-binding protein [Winogradskyella sp. A3E31]|uniref:nickel-binding protein n=1 Tax=Winogradskyella sp. A3E31 TaxID=3349637 RepID=UPI00398B3B4A